MYGPRNGAPDFPPSSLTLIFRVIAQDRFARVVVGTFCLDSVCSRFGKCPATRLRSLNTPTWMEASASSDAVSRIFSKA